LEVEVIYPLNFYPGSYMSPATMWIIFTRILNVILVSYYSCLGQLSNGLVELFHT